MFILRFLDTAEITVRAGKGGNGALSFRREKYVPKGGPDGGDGGRGGHVLLIADDRIQTLADYEYRRRFSADNGNNGRGRNQRGASGTDIAIKVPCGTVVLEGGTGRVLADLVIQGDTLLAARGGRGGRGNSRFASSRRRSPRFSEMGEDGESRNLRLELKILADVGLVGLPNAGKSTLLSAISGSKPQIADYPFTTLSPNLGIMDMGTERLIVADVPGLIEGAHMNRGLGHSFLRHIERTRLLVYVIDLSMGNPVTPLTQWKTLRYEFSTFNPDLLSFPSVVAGNKADLPTDPANTSELEKELERTKTPFFTVSALSGEGIEALKSYVSSTVKSLERPQRESLFIEIEEEDPAARKAERPEILRSGLESDTYIVRHPEVERLVKKFNFDQDEALGRFSAILRFYRIEDILIEKGAREGDTVRIGDVEFVFYPETASSREGDNISERR